MSDAAKQPAAGGQQIQIQLDEEVADGHYANLVLINHSAAEFVLDFARIVPGTSKAKVQTRALLAPMHAKSLLKALQQNVKKYEEQHGEISIKGRGAGEEKQFGFQG